MIEILTVLFCITFVIFLYFLVKWFILLKRKDTDLMFKYSMKMLAAAVVLNIINIIKHCI